MRRGALLGALALFFPQVLGSGHGGILTVMTGARFELTILVALMIAKIAASAISIGSGFRGGMFSSALFIGALFGSVVALIAILALLLAAATAVAITRGRALGRLRASTAARTNDEIETRVRSLLDKAAAGELRASDTAFPRSRGRCP